MSDKNKESKYPVLYVKNFGKIKEAEIELAPFTLFVGDNNSGKSYLMNLIWGIFDVLFGIDYNYKIDILNGMKFGEGVSILELDMQKKSKIVDYFNDIIINNKKIILERIFNSDAIFIETVFFKISDELLNDKKIYIENKTIPFPKAKRDGKTITITITSNISQEELNDEILFFYIIHFIFDLDSNAFLPSSRTGFLLAHRVISVGNWGFRFNKDEAQRDTVFLRSINSFVENLLKLPINKIIKKRLELTRKKVDLYDYLVNFIDDKILDGKVYIDKKKKEIVYEPNQSNTILYPHISSSVVTEIIPLSLFLQYGILDKSLFMEEPEISLHPKLQQEIARVLIKLVNIGKKVIITTHSDIIIQHINNMIKLSNNSENAKKTLMKKFNYETSDIINHDKVRMYQFTVDENHKTKVEKLVASNYGFSVPTFTDYLDRVSDEIQELLKEIKL